MIRSTVGLKRRQFLTDYERKQTRQALAYEPSRTTTHPLTARELERFELRIQSPCHHAQNGKQARSTLIKATLWKFEEILKNW